MEHKQTAFQKFRKYLDDDANLGLVDKKTADRLKWYIDEYFLSLERQIIIDAWEDCNTGEKFELNHTDSGEIYYNNHYGSQAPQYLNEANGKEDSNEPLNREDTKDA